MSLIAAGLLFHEGKILLGQRALGGDLPLFWEFPGGKVEVGESPSKTLQRECREELGITIQIGPLLWQTAYPYPKKWFISFSMLPSQCWVSPRRMCI